jgi:hypothetical protein
MHEALYVDGKLVDTCKRCGLDLRDPVHARAALKSEPQKIESNYNGGA